ncbi:MAG: hypothetical protein SFU53_08110 [Terrimicrobiaceae bacterium]|nr:hypothetical protein [Terrimicrobiaceae bacterium]
MEATRYQRIRLWAGITSIGTNLAVICAAAIAAWVLPWQLSPATTAVALLALAVLIPLSTLPMDILVGQAIEENAEPFAVWFGEWVRGKALCALGMAMGFGLCWAAYVVGPWGPLAFACVVVAGVLRVSMGGGSRDATLDQPVLKAAKQLGGSQLTLRWFDGDPVTPVNGYSVPWSPGVVFLSRSTTSYLSPKQIAALALRELWLQRTGRHALGLIAAVLWALGSMVAAFTIPAPTALAAALGGTAVVSLLAFSSLFVVPALNRRWNSEADREMAARIGAVEAAAILEAIQKANRTDVHLPAAKTAVFHPIPPLDQRTAPLA